MAIRIACYMFLAHTLYAYVSNYIELRDAAALASAGPWQLASDGCSFLRNLAYTAIDAGNCAALTSGAGLFALGDSPVVTDLAGLREATFLAIIDIEDAITWLAVVLAIEFVVLLQERGVSRGLLISGSNWLTIALYAVLLVNAAIWAWKGDWVYDWDQLLWIGGFAAIEMNLSEWREELTGEADAG